MNMKDEKMRVWTVQFAGKGSWNFYASNKATVIAKTMESAMQQVKEKYPDSIFVAITHQGEVTLAAK